MSNPSPGQARKKQKMSEVQNEEQKVSEVQNEEQKVSEVQNEEQKVSEVQNEEQKVSEVHNEEQKVSEVHNEEKKVSEVQNEKVFSLQIGESRFQVSQATFKELKRGVFTIIEGDTYYVDRDGDIFKYILKYIRNKTISFPNDFKDGELLMKEAEFYGLSELMKHLQNGAGKPEIVILHIMIQPKLMCDSSESVILLSWTTEKLEESNFDWETLFKGFIHRLNEFKLYSCRDADFGNYIASFVNNVSSTFVEELPKKYTHSKSHFAFKVINEHVPTAIINGFLMSGFSLVTDRTSNNFKQFGKQYKSVRKLRFQRIKPVN